MIYRLIYVNNAISLCVICKKNCTFAAMNENVIIVDADFVDQVAFNLTVNFERMLERRVPPADLARWVECLVLDSGLREGDHKTTVVMIHDKSHEALQNFVPSSYANELDGKAFSGRLGEFEFHATTGEGFVSTSQLLIDTLQTVLAQQEVKRVMVVPSDQACSEVGQVVRRQSQEHQQVTLFTMQPQPSAPCRQEMLGFSLMAALGISSAEIEGKINQ